ncbi:hypothetical protein PV396_20220 [Streptomyces sp. ME02-8801-2C]|uniref:hypothetical protein n=1 Tax=Streptomyces sp. ME02-8801-2C TaxID=3028680 RepID=UPI0029BC1F22|nr:hypothetical protein [Streptomyces sp. ME02-8801-2C]MDX3454243.1 hypothetical protein [Streptomyces sp. ME02-8801-2C]
MARRALSVTVTTLTATTALLLTGCGGGEKSSPDDIKGADSGASSPSGSASVSDPGGAGAPDMSVPKDVNLVFDFDTPSDAKSAAALANAENYMRALTHGMAQQDPEDPAYKYYSDGLAAKYAKTQIQTMVKGGWTVTGTDEYYNAKATALSNKNIVVTFCRNQGKFFGKEIKTGKILRTEESLASYEKYTLLMNPPTSSSKPWKAMVIEVVGKSQECRAA